jgi:hypothetical protein
MLISNSASIRIGTSEVQRVYLGSDVVWQSGPVFTNGYVSPYGDVYSTPNSEIIGYTQPLSPYQFPLTFPIPLT